MPRKPLTPEQRERKRERDRAYYARKREQAGFTYTPKIKPSFSPTTIAGDILDATKRALSPPKKRKRGKPRPPVPGVTYSPQQRKGTDSFDRFVRDNPHLTARQAIAEYRRVSGQSISNKMGFQRVREIRAEHKDFSKVRFKMYGPDDHPAAGKHFLFPKRFMYLVRYEVEVENQPDTFTQHAYISSDVPYTPEQIYQATLEMFEEGQELGKERYIAKRILPDSITILYGVDRMRKRAS